MFQARGRGGGGQGRGGRGGGAGPQGDCVCSACGEKVKHQPGTPCNSIKCPKCGAAMVRE